MKTLLNIIQRNASEEVGRSLASQHLKQFMHPSCKAAHPHIRMLRDGRSEVEASSLSDEAVGDQRTGRFHDPALCAIADMTACIALDASAPSGASWTKLGMSIDYLSAVSNQVLVAADATAISWTKADEQLVPIEVKDVRDVLVATAHLRVQITPA